MAKINSISRLCTALIVLAVLMIISITAYAAPSDENFDSAGAGDKGTQSYTLNGVTYTTNDSGGLNINIVNDGNIASGGDLSLGYRSSGVNNTTQVTFRTSDGSEFKLNSFVISTGLGSMTVTIKGYRDNSEVASGSITTASYTTFNVSANSTWEYIDEIRITGSDLDIDIDDIDFSPGVPPTHGITYNGNTNTGGSVPTDGNAYHITDTVTVLGNTGSLVKAGYTFTGWNTASNGSGISYSGGDTFAMGSSNVTLYAQWTAVNYSVTYNGNTNTGGSVPTDGSTYHITDTVTVLGNTGSLVKAGYTFTGWNTLANGSGTSYSGGDTFAMGSSNVSLYAQWTENTYSVTYNGNSNTGGSVPVDGTSYHNSDTATVLGNTGSLVRTGYTFAGWNTVANGSGTSYSGGDTFSITTSNVTLYAQWTAVNYSVTYNGNTNTGGSVPTDGSTYHITDTVTVLGNTGSLVKAGYTFTGWNTLANGSGTSYSGGDTFAMGSSNVSLYAQWTENTYSVTYNGNSNTGGSVPVDGSTYHITDTVTVLGNTGSLVKAGYTFTGWNTVANGSGTSYSGGDTFSITTSNVTLYAQWTAVNYSVTYNGNTNTGGSVPTDGSTYHITDTVTVLGNTGSLVKAGYTFTGWNTLANGSGTVYSGGDTFAMGSSNVSLYAQWTENTYSVTYNGNSNTSGSVPVDGTSYHNSDTATALGNTGSLVKAGYTFTGWNTAVNGSGTSYSGGDTFSITTSNVTLYAQWTAVNYSVTYNGNTNTGGSVPTDGSTYHITDIVTILGNTGSLVKAGYTFTGWNTLANGSGTSYSGGDTFAMGSSNVSLYAQWTENTYSVTYNGNSNTGGSVPVDGTSYHNSDTATALGNTGSLVKAGYTFAGWNTVANGSGTSYSGGDTFSITTSNVTLYAQWTAVNYSVTYNGNTNTGGSVPTDGSTYHITDTVTVLGNTGSLVKAGYTFTGWNTAANGSGTVYSGGDTFAMGSSNVSLYAQWTSSGSSGGGGGGSTATGQSTANIVVNGKTENAGTETTSTESGKSTVTVAVDNKTIESKIEEAVKTNITGQQNVIQVPVSDTKSEVVKVALTGDIVKQLETNTFDVSVKRDAVEYIIPAKELTISNVAKELGVAETSLKDIQVEVKITKLEDSIVAKYNEVAKENGATIVFPPTAFEVVAKTTNAAGKTEDVKISKFSNYVERVMEIPSGVDPSKITTGIVFNADGTYSHVPTDIYQNNGKWYARLNSLTNSDYTLVWNPVTVKSVENHWAKEVVNDMASRLVIFDTENFEPNKGITRADFAEYIVRALGIYREGEHENTFKDVSATGDRTLAVLIANEYGIVTGYSDGTFRGDNQITREEAMTMYQRAMKITDLTGTDTNRYQSYTDYGQVSKWATPYVNDVLAAHVFNGTTATTISPKSILTYAESAQAIENLLIESKLINQE